MTLGVPAVQAIGQRQTILQRSWPFAGVAPASEHPCPAKLSGSGRSWPPHGAIAQLEERLDRTQEVVGSSPTSSMTKALQTRPFRVWLVSVFPLSLTESGQVLVKSTS
jgi:hypothetical protein